METSESRIEINPCWLVCSAKLPKPTKPDTVAESLCGGVPTTVYRECRSTNFHVDITFQQSAMTFQCCACGNKKVYAVDVRLFNTPAGMTANVNLREHKKPDDEPPPKPSIILSGN